MKEKSRLYGGIFYWKQPHLGFLNLFINYWFTIDSTDSVVPNTSKILKRKQFTTINQKIINKIGCSQYFKDTKKEAIHNCRLSLCVSYGVVPNTSKILKRKQFTTVTAAAFVTKSCSQYFKDTKKEAIHISIPFDNYTILIVFNVTKVIENSVNWNLAVIWAPHLYSF